MKLSSRYIKLCAVVLLCLSIVGFSGILVTTVTHAASSSPHNYSNGTPPPSTTSWYKTTLGSATTQNEGCTAAKGATGLIILDYGEPYYSSGSYGTLLTSVNTFASDASIQANVTDFLRGANSCSLTGTNLKIAVGTSNDNSEGLSTSQLSAAGQAWANIVNASINYIHANSHITVYAADDIEVDYSTYAEAKAFIDGYHAGTTALLANYGDDPDGANGDGSSHSWTAQQMWYVTSGAPNEVAIPEIYYSANATEWAQLSAWACNNIGRPVDILGTMAQNGYEGSLSPDGAWQTMYNTLTQSSNSCVSGSYNHLYYSTNILS